MKTLALTIPLLLLGPSAQPNADEPCGCSHTAGAGCEAQMERTCPPYGTTPQGCQWTLNCSSVDAAACDSRCAFSYVYTEACPDLPIEIETSTFRLLCGNTSEKTWGASSPNHYAGIRAYCKPCPE